MYVIYVTTKYLNGTLFNKLNILLLNYDVPKLLIRVANIPTTLDIRYLLKNSKYLKAQNQI